MFVKLYVTVMYQCVYGNLIPIMLRKVYLSEPPYGIIYVYWYGSPTGDKILDENYFDKILDENNFDENNFDDFDM